MSERSRTEFATTQVTEVDGPQIPRPPAWRLSPDSWAVLLALGLAALVKLHVITTVKW